MLSNEGSLNRRIQRKRMGMKGRTTVVLGPSANAVVRGCWVPPVVPCHLPLWAWRLILISGASLFQRKPVSAGANRSCCAGSVS